MASGVHPREVLAKMLPRSTVIPSDIDEMMLWRAIIDIMTEPARRKKLPNVNTMEDVIHLIKNSKKIMVLTGAGVSTIASVLRNTAVVQVKMKNLRPSRTQVCGNNSCFDGWKKKAPVGEKNPGLMSGELGCPLVHCERAQ